MEARQYRYGNARAQTGGRKAPFAPSSSDWQITPETRLLPVLKAEEYFAEKGIELMASTLRQRCRSGQWQEGQYWVKPLSQYLIAVDIVWAAIVNGQKL